VKQVLRIVAVLEAISFLVLVLVAVPLKYAGDQEAGVKVMGPVHGVLFVLFVLLTIFVAADERWRLKRTLLTLLCAVIPFGGFIADRKLIGPNEPAATA
jgi:integral membrane protein